MVYRHKTQKAKGISPWVVSVGVVGPRERERERESPGAGFGTPELGNEQPHLYCFQKERERLWNLQNVAF
jgi:hypothetical protein